MAERASSKASANCKRPKSQHSLFLPGLGLLGGVSIFTAGSSFAQTPVAESVNQSIPNQSAESATVDVAPIAPIAPPAAAPESFPTEFSPMPRSQPVIPVVPPAATAPATPATSSDGYLAPSTIIFSERSTGCKAMVPSGQTPNSVCGGVRVPSVSGSPSVPGFARNTPGSMTGRGGALDAIAPRVAVGATSSLRDFYRRTMRPPAQLGNGNVRLIFPLSIPAPISSLFGWRIHPITGDTRFHTGTDLAAPIGTPVLAAYAGQVAIADFLGGYGLTVAINHTQGTQQTLYAHLSEVFVQAGDQIKQGEVIGRVGSTGNSTGPHLHFEFRQLTPDGWVALDAGAQLEYALAQLVSSLEIVQATSAPIKANAGVQGVMQ